MSDIVERLRLRRDPLTDGERAEAADEIDRLHRKVQELEAAIRQHRADVWSDSEIEHPADKRLYEALGDD